MATQAEAPLLSRREQDDDEDDVGLDEYPLEEDDDHVPVPDSHKQYAHELSYFTWLLTLSAGISGLLFGCMLCFSHHLLSP